MVRWRTAALAGIDLSQRESPMVRACFPVIEVSVLCAASSRDLAKAASLGSITCKECGGVCVYQQVQTGSAAPAGTTTVITFLAI